MSKPQKKPSSNANTDDPPVFDLNKLEGVAKDLPPELIKFDLTYQRGQSQDRIARIAADFCVPACGVLLISQRANGEYYAMDGMHRTLAAIRARIPLVSCKISQIRSIADEARIFKIANTVRGNMPMFNIFRADLVAGEPRAVAVAKMIEDSGYTLAKSGKKPFTVVCVGAVLEEFSRDEGLARRVWNLMVSLSQGHYIPALSFSGMCYLERFTARNKPLKISSICTGKEAKLLLSAGPMRVFRACEDHRIELKKSGPLVFANGIVTYILNQEAARVKGTTKKFPNLFLFDAIKKGDNDE